MVENEYRNKHTIDMEALKCEFPVSTDEFRMYI